MHEIRYELETVHEITSWITGHWGNFREGTRWIFEARHHIYQNKARKHRLACLLDFYTLCPVYLQGRWTKLTHRPAHNSKRRLIPETTISFAVRTTETKKPIKIWMIPKANTNLAWMFRGRVMTACCCWYNIPTDSHCNLRVRLSSWKLRKLLCWLQVVNTNHSFLSPRM